MVLKRILFTLFLLTSLLSPSFAQQDMVVIKTTDQERDILEPFIRKAVQTSSNYFKEAHGLELRRPIQLIISRDFDYIKDEMLNISEPFMRDDQVQRMIRQRCNPQRKFNAFASLFFITFCLSPHVELDKKWEASTRKWLDRTVAHELVHVHQRQLAGADLNNNSKNPVTGRRHMGPDWMIEGNAEHFHRDIDPNRRTAKAEIKQLSIRATRIDRTLRQLMPTGTIKNSKDYTISYYATFLLVERFGQEAIFNYWRMLGHWVSWETAFLEAFGISLDGFLNDFEDIKLNADAAYAWTQQP